MCIDPPPLAVVPWSVPVLLPVKSIPVFKVSVPVIVYLHAQLPLRPFPVEKDHVPSVDEDGTNWNDGTNGLLVLRVKGFSKSQISPETIVSPAFPLALYGAQLFLSTFAISARSTAICAP